VAKQIDKCENDLVGMRDELQKQQNAASDVAADIASTQRRATEFQQEVAVS
jgi:hypothetical protein